MTYFDLIIGPLYLILIFSVAYFVRPYFTDHLSKKYFLPALGLKMIAAIFLGLLYQYYYVGEGGDTFGYYHGAKIIWGYFLENPIDAVKVIFWDGDFGDGMYKLVSRIPHFKDPASFYVDRVACLFGLFTFGNYTGIALLFALVSFSGSWALYSVLKKIYPDLSMWLAITILFIPSVVFWGSGIMKDTLTFSALCWMIWCFSNIFIIKSKKVISIIILVITAVTIFSIKKYILMLLLPSLILWYFRLNIGKVKNPFIRIAVAPILIIIMLYSGYQTILNVGANDARYSIDNISTTVYVTARDIRYITGKQAGSGYYLGTIPESWQDMVRMFPAAVNVSLYRPYLWEVSNPLMLMLAFESLIFLLLSLYILYKSKLRIFQYFTNDPFLAFALVFVLGFGFAVGISTWNFGTLVRYKLPLMPLFGSMLVILLWYSTKGRRQRISDSNA